mmetsp:Transcript_464/g.858  ORF Transcript_464/g.858 Transcript_464/m.858 type:complete len:338 (-) Transcript_464:293-1306(-)
MAPPKNDAGRTIFIQARYNLFNAPLYVVLGAAIAFLAIVVLAILLPLVLQPQRTSRLAAFNLYLVIVSVAHIVYVSVLIAKWRTLGAAIPWNGNEDWYKISEAMADEVISIKWFSPVAYLSSVTITWSLTCMVQLIYKVLKNCKKFKKYEYPSFKEVTFHGLVSLFFAVVAALLMLLLELKTVKRGVVWTIWIIDNLILWLPIVVCLVIGLLGTTKHRLTSIPHLTNEVKILLTSLLYIVFTNFVGVAISVALSGFAARVASNTPVLYWRSAYAADVFWGLSALANCYYIGQKVDVKKMIRDLFNGKTLGVKDYKDENEEETAPEDKKNQKKKPMAT